MSYKDRVDVAISPILESADAEIASLNTTIGERNATIALRDETILGLTQELTITAAERDAALKALEECQNPEQPYTLALGYCPYPNTVSEVQRLSIWSGGTVRRTYKPPGAFPAPGREVFAGDFSAGLRTAHTIKGPVPFGTPDNMKNRLERLLTGLDDEVWIAYILRTAKDSILGLEHEPEDDFRDGGWDKGIYRRAQRKFSRLVREANFRDGGQRLVAGNLMSSTTDTESLAFYPGDGFWDIFGVDGYNWPSRAPGQAVPRWREAEEIFTPDKAFADSLGLPFAIFEFGCRKTGRFEEANDPDYVQTEAEVQAQRDWCAKARTFFIQKAQPVVATYFHHDWWQMKQVAHAALGGR